MVKLFMCLLFPMMLYSQQKVKWYDLHGKRMANGKIYDRNGMTCASSSAYNLGDILEVQSIKDKRKIKVMVTDRGNFEKDGVTLDLSPRAFRMLFPLKQGVGLVRIKRISKGAN